jgi:hypothetical protein
MTTKIKINRAPVLTLWACVVAERLGHSKDTALTLGKALAGLNAQSKGQRIGIFEKPSEDRSKEADRKKSEAETGQQTVSLLGRQIAVRETEQGLRAEASGKPINPDGVETYLKQKFKDNYAETLQAMQALAQSYEPTLLERRGYELYEEFRPKIPEGKRGWGAAGELDLDKLQSLKKDPKKVTA